MTEKEAKGIIVYMVASKQGCKATELVADKEVLPVIPAGFDIPKLIQELVWEQKLVEVEYSLPDMEWRCKSFLLPGKTEVRVVVG
jgi:hypothetical protein